MWRIKGLRIKTPKPGTCPSRGEGNQKCVVLKSKQRYFQERVNPGADQEKGCCEEQGGEVRCKLDVTTSRCPVASGGHSLRGTGADAHVLGGRQVGSERAQTMCKDFSF